MRQEVDIRYVVTSPGSAQHLYENVYCQHGQIENLIKLHKAQLARIARRVTARRPIRCDSFFTPPRSGRRDPSHQPTRQLRVRDDPRPPDQNRRTRHRAYRAHPRPVADELPGARLFRAVALGLMRSGP